MLAKDSLVALSRFIVGSNRSAPTLYDSPVRQKPALLAPRLSVNEGFHCSRIFMVVLSVALCAKPAQISR
jgi:hypothetical protein